MAKGSVAPGPTPDLSSGRVPSQDDTQSSSGAFNANASPDATGDGWFTTAWRNTARDAETTLKFIETEHAKNVQKFEQGLNEIKTTAEELADGFQSQMEGRKSLKLLREEVSLAETACAAAQVALVTVSKETQLAEVRLRDAGGPKRAAGEVTRRAETARASLVIARSAFSAARAETQRREDALRAAEIALAESLEKRNLIHLLWKRNHLTPEETETQRLLLEEARRLNAALSIQRNFRAVLEKRRAKERAAERRKKMNASVVRGVKTLGSFVLLYLVLSVFGKACSGAWNARHAAAEKVTNAIDQVTNAARLLTPLDHGYLRSGLGSRDNIGEHLGLRDRNRVLHETIDVLEVELRSASAALLETSWDSPCVSCARDATGRLDAEERLSPAEERARSLSLEVVTLRAVAVKMGAGDKEVRRLGKSGAGAAQAWLVDPSLGYSAQVAAAATAAAAVTTRTRIAGAVAAARYADEEAEAAKVENEVLRALIDQGLLPGAAVAAASSGACWAAVSQAKAETQIAAAATASAHALRTAERLMSGKLAAYADAKREAERESETYKVELEALKAAAPELRDVADAAEAAETGKFDSSGSGSSSLGSAAAATRKRRVGDHARVTVVGAAKLVAAAKLASERVGQAASALRDAESRAEVLTVELETLRVLVAGNGTAGVVERAEGWVSELPGAVARAREAVEGRSLDRLRATEEARARAETLAEVYRVELFAAREMEVTRAKASAKRGGASLPPIFSRAGEIDALTKEVKRLEKALATKSAKLKLKPNELPVSPESAAAAARVATVAAADAAAEADAANDTWRNSAPAPIVRRVAGWIVARVLGEDPPTTDALKRRVSSLEKRLAATRIAAAAGSGSVCEAALVAAADATRRAEQRAEAVAIDHDAARNFSLALAASRGAEDAARGAAEALMGAADKHRELLAAERGISRATLESCRAHAAASSQRAFVAAKAAADTSDLFARHKLRLAGEALEARREEAMRVSLGQWSPSSLNDTGAVGFPSGVYQFDPVAIAATAETALQAVQEAETRATALSGKFRQAETRFKLAPGTLDVYEPYGYSGRDTILCAFVSAVATAIAVTVLSRFAIQRLVIAKARVATLKRGLELKELSVAELNAKLKVASVSAKTTLAEMARGLYLDFDDGNNLGTVVDEMRVNLQQTSELNDAVRGDNDWLRAQLREAKLENAAFTAVPIGGWCDSRKLEEERDAELYLLRAEVERLRTARLDATAVAAACAFEFELKRKGGGSAQSEAPKTSGSPSFRAGIFAARDAAAREAAALRDESVALRDANTRLLHETTRLRSENHELMEDLGGASAPFGVTARDAARSLRAEICEMTEIADAHADTILAERTARFELVARIAQLAKETTRERRALAKVYCLGACVAFGVAVASGASYGVVGVLPLSNASSGYAALCVASVAGVVAVCLLSWAVVFSVPNRLVKSLTAPITHVALVDEDLVEPAGVAVETVDDEATAAETAGADVTATTGPKAATTSSTTTTASTSRAATTQPSASADPNAAPGSEAEDMALDDGEASVVGRALRGIRKVWRPETDVEEDEHALGRDLEIKKLREELRGIQVTADRLRVSRTRLAKRVTSARDENDALFSARAEVMSIAETMSSASAARTSVAGAASVSGDMTKAEFALHESRETNLVAQLGQLRLINERMDRELTAMRVASEQTAAEAEAGSASAALETQLSEGEATRGMGHSEVFVSGDRSVKNDQRPHQPPTRVSKAEKELPAALERAAHAESRAAQLESSRDAAANAAAEERRALSLAAATATKEVEWLQRARERLLAEVATLRTANTNIENDLKLSQARIAVLELDVRENYGAVGGLEKKLRLEKNRADVLFGEKTSLERERSFHQEKAAAAIAAAEAATLSCELHTERDVDVDALDAGGDGKTPKIVTGKRG